MSGTKSTRKIAADLLSKPPVAAPVKETGTVVSKPVSAPLTAAPGDCRVEVAIEAALGPPAVQLKPLNSTAESSKAGPSSKGPAALQFPAAANATDTSSAPVPARNMPTAKRAVSRLMEPEMKPATVEPVVVGTARATQVAASATPVPTSVVPVTETGTATCTAGAHSRLGHYISLAIQAYTKPVYYVAGAALGFMTAVRSELGLAAQDK